MQIGLYCGDYHASHQTKINNEGDWHFSTSVKIANKECSNTCSKQEMISSKSWVKGSVDFEDVPNLNVIEGMQINLYYYKKGYKDENLILRDMPVE